MKLLFLTPQLPYPPQQGTTIRNYNIIKELGPRHEIHLLSFGRVEQLEGSPLNELCSRIEIMDPPVRSLPRRAFDTVASPLPDMAKRLNSRALAYKLGEMLWSEKYDVLQIEGIEMASNWLRASGSDEAMPAGPSGMTRVTRPLVKSIFDNHNAEYVLQKSAFESDRNRMGRLHAAAYSYIQWHKLEKFEREICIQAKNVTVVSENDAKSIAMLGSGIHPVVIPNGVEISHYVPSSEVCAKPLADISVVFTGKMDFRPNTDAAIWFAREILPVIRRLIPLAHISFVGQQPNSQVRALAALPGVQVTGWVADTRPYIADAAVYAVPLRMGGGTRLKVLEAMAMGKGIVSTTLGAEGIECMPGRDLIVADRTEDFAQAVVGLIRDPKRRQELGVNARKLVEEKYDWRKIVPRFEAIYDAKG